MEPSVLKQFGDQLQHERRALVRELSHNEEGLEAITETGREELEEQAQRQRDAFIPESLDERAHNRPPEIDAALARIEAGTFGQFEDCEERSPSPTSPP